MSQTAEAKYKVPQAKEQLRVAAGDAEEQRGDEDWLCLFQLPPGRDTLAAVRNSSVLLDYLLSRRPYSHDSEWHTASASSHQKFTGIRTRLSTQL